MFSVHRKYVLFFSFDKLFFMYKMNIRHNNQCDKHRLVFRTATLFRTLANSAKEL